ncbi:glycosyltransferase family 4 protein [Polyangium jinanense]|uniref:Glycosyltransferase family 4 protein n=1 Tax=Polyangium jinanense TaxID=2829994 RepID=A0A9X3X7Y0_9BACT|nr:glycosyltransferase family 4 protein [Polyangium jinanense]MDC3983868.1 glycosyltransferase family 4 protein [Polyangium jinanense]
MVRIAILATHPIQYQAPLYRALAAREDVAIKLFFCWDFGVKETRDPGFGKTIRWDVPLLEGYDHEFVPNVSKRPGTDHFFGLVNPGAFSRMSAFRPDVIIVHGYAHATEHDVMLRARQKGIPVLLRGESNLLAERPAHISLAKRLALPPIFRRLGGALAIGTLSAHYFEHYGVPKERVFIAPYTVDNSFFQSQTGSVREEARAFRKELGIPEDDLVVNYAAKLIPVKGCADLIRAFAARPRPNAHLVLIGDGPLRGELESLARSLSARVHFVGFVNQKRMPAAYALGDVFALPSRFEPWGLAVNEAMNLGLPIIASDQVGAVPDLVGPDNGWVFPAGSVPALTRVLDEALAHPDARVSRGKASLRRIAAWDIPHTAEGFVRAARAVWSRS